MDKVLKIAKEKLPVESYKRLKMLREIEIEATNMAKQDAKDTKYFSRVMSKAEAEAWVNDDSYDYTGQSFMSVSIGGPSYYETENDAYVTFENNDDVQEIMYVPERKFGAQDREDAYEDWGEPIEINDHYNEVRLRPGAPKAKILEYRIDDDNISTSAKNGTNTQIFEASVKLTARQRTKAQILLQYAKAANKPLSATDNIMQYMLSKIRSLRALEYIRYEDDGKLYVKTFLIDDQRNNNGWRASWNSIKNNVKSFHGRPGIEYFICDIHGCNRDHTAGDTLKDSEHEQESYRVTTIVDTILDEATHTAYAIHRVDDKQFAEKIEKGEIKYLSPSIWPNREKTTLTLSEHDEWYIDTTDWEGLHDAWVDSPAYGHKARIVGACKGDESCIPELKTKSLVGRALVLLPYAKAFQAVKGDDEKGNWITVKGSAVFIPDGADKGQAIKDHFNSLKKKTEPKIPSSGGRKVDIDEFIQTEDDLYGAIDEYLENYDDITETFDTTDSISDIHDYQGELDILMYEDKETIDAESYGADYENLRTRTKSLEKLAEQHDAAGQMAKTELVLDKLTQKRFDETKTIYRGLKDFNFIEDYEKKQTINSKNYNSVSTSFEPQPTQRFGKIMLDIDLDSVRDEASPVLYSHFSNTYDRMGVANSFHSTSEKEVRIRNGAKPKINKMTISADNKFSEKDITRAKKFAKDNDIKFVMSGK